VCGQDRRKIINAPANRNARSDAIAIVNHVVVKIEIVVDERTSARQSHRVTEVVIAGDGERFRGRRVIRGHAIGRGIDDPSEEIGERRKSGAGRKISRGGIRFGIGRGE